MSHDFTTPTFPIFASADGTVLSVRDGVVFLELNDGRRVRYFHVNDITVAEGDKVARGQQIGTGHGYHTDGSQA